MEILMTLIVNSFASSIYNHKFKIIDIPIVSIFTTILALIIAIPVGILGKTLVVIHEYNFLDTITFGILLILFTSITIMIIVYCVILIFMPIVTWYLNLNKREK